MVVNATELTFFFVFPIFNRRPNSQRIIDCMLVRNQLTTDIISYLINITPYCRTRIPCK
jgi:hypothetical protein